MFDEGGRAFATAAAAGDGGLGDVRAALVVWPVLIFF